MNKNLKLIFIPLLVSLVLTPLNYAKANTNSPLTSQDYVSDEIIVDYFEAGTPAEKEAVRAKSRKDVSAVSFEQISPRVSHTEVIKLGKGVSVEAAIARLKNQPGIRFAEPNYIVHALDTTTDPYFTVGQLWGMGGSTTTPANTFGSNAAGAWASGYIGSSNVVVGVIDEGIDISHPELAANIWTNPGETRGDGVDNDNNGYIDDINGWDFANNNASVYDGGTLDKHGTHVSGTIGASSNGTGVVGVNWNVKIISTKFLAATGGSLSNAIKAIDYLNALKIKGINIVATNNSWGGGGYSQTLLDAINRGGDQGILFIAAAGNSTSNNDTTASYPSNYVCTTPTRASDCVIAVAAIDSAGGIASFSSYGATTVDIGAPGVNIWSSLPGNTYGSYNGTSMATPHVTGAAALCKSIYPSITPAQIRDAIISSAASTPSLSLKTVTGGRLDVGAMATKCAAFLNLSEQTPILQLQNSNYSGPAGTAVALATSGGSGSGAVSFSSSGLYCVISNNSINATAPTTCTVTATKAGDGTYKAATSAPVTFTFTSIPQVTPLVISNTITTNIAKGTNGVTLQTTGGTGTGAVTYATTSIGCVIRSNKLTVAKTVPNLVSCSVIATKAASGIYSLAISSPKIFTFK